MSGFLTRVYAPATPDEVRALYDRWAATYDAEIAAAGYATPARIATALRAAGADPAAPALDFGCGTGVSGAALRAAGFAVIDGVDLSDEMLAEAAAKGLYRRLARIGPEDAPPAGYAAIAAVGVIGPTSAPLPVLQALHDALAPGGLLALSLNDHALADPAYPALARALGTLLFEEHGEHLPGIGLGASVFVIRRAG